jgi:hypothetical protein
MSNYPDGAENDPFAPYNQDEWEQVASIHCDECEDDEFSGDYDGVTVTWSGNRRIGFAGSAECPAGHIVEVEYDE